MRLVVFLGCLQAWPEVLSLFLSIRWLLSAMPAALLPGTPTWADVNVFVQGLDLGGEAFKDELARLLLGGLDGRN